MAKWHTFFVRVGVMRGRVKIIALYAKEWSIGKIALCQSLWNVERAPFVKLGV